jgi:hypothetical protein
MGGCSGLQNLTECGGRGRSLFRDTTWRFYGGEDKTYLKELKHRRVDCFRRGYDWIWQDLGRLVLKSLVAKKVGNFMLFLTSKCF